MSPEDKEGEGDEAKPETAEASKNKAGGFRQALGAPARFDAEEFLKAIRAISDKGGRAMSKEVLEIFGGPKKRETLGRSLGFADELGFLASEGNKYVVTEEGRNLLAANDEKKEAMLARRLVEFGPYRDVFLRLKEEGTRGLKKDILTEMWANLAGGGGKRIRQDMTTTFSSLAKYAGLITDSGRTCVITPLAAPLMEGKASPQPQGGTEGHGVQPEPPAPPVGFENITCPRCNQKDFGVVDEQVVNYFAGEGQTIVFVKYTFHCRSCKESFSRHGQRTVTGALPG